MSQTSVALRSSAVTTPPYAILPLLYPSHLLWSFHSNTSPLYIIKQQIIQFHHNKVVTKSGILSFHCQIFKNSLLTFQENCASSRSVFYFIGFSYKAKKQAPLPEPASYGNLLKYTSPFSFSHRWHLLYSGNTRSTSA